MDNSSDTSTLGDEDKLFIIESVRTQLGENTLHVPYKITSVNKVQEPYNSLTL
jgi:hypothetical protein